MILFVSALITLAVFAFLSYPLLRPKPELEPKGDVLREGLLLKRDSVYSAIKELEFDYQIGNLSEKDRKDLEEKYKEKAVTILKELDEWDKGKPAEDGIEKQVKALRGLRPKSTPVEEEIEKEVQALRKVKSEPRGRFCPHCGARVLAADRFCSECGTNLVDRQAE